MTPRPKRPTDGTRWMVTASLTCPAIVLLALLGCMLWLRSTPEGWDRLGPVFAIFIVWTYAGPAIFVIGVWLGLHAVWRGSRWGWLGAGANIMCVIAVFIITGFVGR